MARPHLDWQQLGSLQFSPCANRMGTLTKPTMLQLIMRCACSPTITMQTIPVNASLTLVLQLQNEQLHESSFFYSPLLNLKKTSLKSLARKAMQCPAPLFLPAVPMKDKKYYHNPILRFICSLCTSWILQQQGDCKDRRFFAMLKLWLLLFANSCW